MERARILRFLRYAVAALSVTACALLLALWVRSYSYRDHLWIMAHAGCTIFYAMKGELHCEQGAMIKPVDLNWDLTTLPVEEWMEPLSGRGRWHVEPDRVSVVVPYWSVVVATALIASACWLPWFNWRFSLRTLLIATTLVAVLLGAMVATR